jgi:hypothetical protein
MSKFSNLSPYNGRHFLSLDCCINMPQYTYAWQYREMDVRLSRAVFCSFIISLRLGALHRCISNPHTKPAGCIFSASGFYFFLVPKSILAWDTDYSVFFCSFTQYFQSNSEIKNLNYFMTGNLGVHKFYKTLGMSSKL